MPTIARSHSDSLNVVCWKKPKSVRKVTTRFEDLIRQLVYKNYSTTNYYHPRMICDVCRITITDIEKVSFYNIFYNVIIFHKLLIKCHLESQSILCDNNMLL